jgi:hypothetical protein
MNVASSFEYRFVVPEKAFHFDHRQSFDMDTVAKGVLDGSAIFPRESRRFMAMTRNSCLGRIALFPPFLCVSASPPFQRDNIGQRTPPLAEGTNLLFGDANRQHEFTISARNFQIHPERSEISSARSFFWSTVNVLADSLLK